MTPDWRMPCPLPREDIWAKIFDAQEVVWRSAASHSHLSTSTACKWLIDTCSLGLQPMIRWWDHFRNKNLKMCAFKLCQQPPTHHLHTHRWVEYCYSQNIDESHIIWMLLLSQIILYISNPLNILNITYSKIIGQLLHLRGFYAKWDYFLSI